MRLYLTDTELPKRNRHIPFILTLVMVAIVFTVWAMQTQPDAAFYISLGWLLTVSFMLWFGNRALTHRLDRYLPWNQWGNMRFFIHLTLGLGFLLVLVNLTYMVLKLTLTTDPPTHEQMIVMNVYAAFIFIPLFSIYFSLYFLRHWRESELEVEKFQKENIRSQFSSLKKHLDPHFLFNNLNILSALVDKDTARSKQFIEHLADVYRSLLRKTSDDLIPLPEELAFIESYIYLLRTRFGDNIQFTINLKPEHKTRTVPPLTLQMLIENAIKHNVIHDHSPLAIHLLQLDEDYLMVSNSLNESTEKQQYEVRSGLQNIRNRYKYFTESPVKIIKTKSHFEVHIPLLQIDRV
jgi:LytS/YehU family sensor histidine kinase